MKIALSKENYNRRYTEKRSDPHEYAKRQMADTLSRVGKINIISTLDNVTLEEDKRL